MATTTFVCFPLTLYWTYCIVVMYYVAMEMGAAPFEVGRCVAIAIGILGPFLLGCVIASVIESRRFAELSLTGWRLHRRRLWIAMAFVGPVLLAGLMAFGAPSAGVSAAHERGDVRAAAATAAPAPAMRLRLDRW